MRIIVLLSWYDEQPEWLAATISSCHGFADHVVAVDGAYALYPGGKGQSPVGQAEAVRHTARALGMGVTLHEPASRWYGNEVEKRAYMFRLAETVAEPGMDWYFVMDGDQVVSDLRCDLKARLAATEFDAGEAMFWSHRGHHTPDARPFVSEMDEQEGAVRMMFRAMPGLTVEGMHHRYVTPDGRQHWGPSPTERAEDFQDDVLIEHRNHMRDLGRNKQREGYYQRRGALDIEGVGR